MGASSLSCPVDIITQSWLLIKFLEDGLIRLTYYRSFRRKVIFVWSKLPLSAKLIL
jgi:hypothetical protein